MRWQVSGSDLVNIVKAHLYHLLKLLFEERIGLVLWLIVQDQSLQVIVVLLDCHVLDKLLLLIKSLLLAQRVDDV